LFFPKNTGQKSKVQTMKMSKELYSQLAEMLDGFKMLNDRSNMRGFRNILKANPKVKSVNVRFAWDILRCMPLAWRAKFIDDCYAAGLNDSHITSALLAYMRKRDLLDGLETTPTDAAASTAAVDHIGRPRPRMWMH
jgi:hypothetical protein